MTTRVVYMGTPDFAVPALQALIAADAYDVVGVFTQPDRRQGRGKKLAPPPVKVAAEAADVPVFQPEILKADEAQQQLFDLNADVIIVAAYGQILKKAVLDHPPHGCINIHASLLPRWRGAAPIAAAIHSGDAETGVTLMQMNEGLDTGPMIAKRSVPIERRHTRGNLTDELAQVGAALLIETLPQWLAGELTAEPQDEALATLAPRLRKEQGAIDWTQSADEIERQVRAFAPWPGTFTTVPAGLLKVIEVERAADISAPSSPPGTLFKAQKRYYVTTGEGVLRLLAVQPAGKKAMAAEALLNGQPELLGVQLGRS